MKIEKIFYLYTLKCVVIRTAENGYCLVVL